MKITEIPIPCTINRFCKGALKRMPEIYFLPCSAFYGCEKCGKVVRYDFVDVDTLENPQIDERTHDEYMKEFAERGPEGAV